MSGEEKPYRGFDDTLEHYYIGEKQWAIKKLKGNPHKALADTYQQLQKDNETALDLSSQLKVMEKQDAWTKQVLETYLDKFNYDKELADFEITELRASAGELFSFLVIIGTSLREQSLSRQRYLETQKSLQENLKSKKDSKSQTQSK